MSANTVKVTSIMGGDANSRVEHENAKLRARISELEHLVATDALTHLFNRRHFMVELDRCCRRANRYGGTYGLLYFDVDRLKAVNDIQGHVIGDDVLRGVAKALLGAVRRSDIVSRVGGDEFTILLDMIKPEQLAKKAALMRTLLTELPIKTAGPTLKISVSLGCALIESKSDAADLLDAADKAMYAHKHSKSQV
jgi:diguanylate cyclase (GGDEF)-like protein